MVTVTVKSQIIINQNRRKLQPEGQRF